MGKSLSLQGYNYLTMDKHSSIDKYYGPYFIGDSSNNVNGYQQVTSPEWLLDYLLNGKADIGLTVGIVSDDNTIQEYWILYEDGELKLVEKSLSFKLNPVTLEALPVYEDGKYKVTLRYSGIGKVIKGKVRYYRDGVLIPTTLYNEEYSTGGGEYIIPSETIGEHTYKIEISDLYGTTVDSTKIIKVGILRILTTDKFNALRNKKKRVPSDINFSLQILNLTITDENPTGTIKNIQVVDNSNNNILDFTNEVTGELLTINLDLTDKNIGGKMLYIKAFNSSNLVIYTFDLFEVLDLDTLFVQVRKNDNLFVEGNTVLFSFIFRSGALSINDIVYDTSSDFTFEKFSINFGDDGEEELLFKITPKNVSSKLENAKIVFKYNGNRIVPVTLGTINKYVESSRSVEWDFSSYNSNRINSCYIDFTSELLYPTDSNEDYIVYFNEYMWINNDVIHVGNGDDAIEIATPLYESEPVYIGMGYGIRDYNTNLSDENENFRYNCICINGMIVRITRYLTRPWSNITATWLNITNEKDALNIITDTSGNLCRGIWIGYPLSLLQQGKFKFELNYELDMSPEVNDSIATLTLTAINVEDENYDSMLSSFVHDNENYKWDSDFRNVTFGTIKDGYDKYEVTDFTTWEITDALAKNVKLFKISTALKEKKDINTNKSLKIQKRWGVLCLYLYKIGENVIDSGPVIVYTLGTSTLNYPIPNFRLNFNNTQRLLEGVSDSYLTAKADYMESAHLNNTPLAMLYNKVLKSNTWNNNDYDKSPSIENNMLDAIKGEPVIIKILDVGGNEINLGSFMLNTDKNSSTMGLNIEEGVMSFEGHSNEVTEASSRFTYGIDSQTHNDITEEDLKTGGVIDETKVIDFLKAGIEERQLYSTDENETENDMWMTFYNNYWKVIEQHSLKIPDPNDPEKMIYEDYIDNVVSVDYCCLYIIFLMIFGMTDNLGKNAMFDIWKLSGNWGKMYPRFYDLDSSCGLDNAGDLDVLPFVLVSEKWIPESIREFVHNNFGWDSINNDDITNLNYKYIKSSKMYKYSSKESRLWNYIFDKHKSEIITMYSVLRQNELDFDNLVEFFEDTIINVIPYTQYNQDFLNKYLGNPAYLEFMYGNRWTNFKDWIRSRLAFCDSLFKYKTAEIKVDGEVTVKPTYMFPAYVCVSSQADTESWGFGYEPSASGGAGGNIEIRISLADSIITNLLMFDTSKYKTDRNDTCRVYDFANLRELTIGGTVAPDLSKCINLKKLIITESSGYNEVINVPKSVTELYRYARANPPYFYPKTIKINFPDLDSELKIIDLDWVTFNENVNLSTITQLETLTLSHCTFNGTLTLPASEINFTAEDCTFNSINISDGAIINALELNNQTINNFNLRGTIKRIDLYNSVVENEELNLSNVTGVQCLNLIKSNIRKVIVGDNTFAPSFKLGLLQSLVEIFRKSSDSDEIGVNLDIFMGKTITSIINYTSSDSRLPILNLALLKYEGGTYKGISNEGETFVSKELTGLSFGLTKIVKVNSSVAGTITGVGLFALCSELESVTARSLIILSSDWVFSFSPKLNNLSNVKINKFLGAFLEDTISYTLIEGSILKSSTNGNFSYFMCMYRGTPLITINANNYPTLTSVYRMFSQSFPNTYFGGSGEGLITKITINNQFTIASTCTAVNEMFYRCRDIRTSGNIFNSYSNITSANGTFGYCAVDDIRELKNMTNLTIATGMYYCSSFRNSIVDSNNKLILPHTKLNSCLETFSGATFYDDTIIVDDFIKNVNDATIIDLRGCFFNAKKNDIAVAKIDDHFTINSNISSVPIKISGFLSIGYENLNDKETKIIYKTNFKTEGSDYTGFRGGYRDSVRYPYYCGPFSNRRTQVNAITLGDLNENNNLLDYYLCLVNPLNGISVNIYNPNSLKGTFYRVKHDLLINSIESNNTFSANMAFKRCEFANRNDVLPDNIMENVTSAEQMFAGSSLREIHFNLRGSSDVLVDSTVTSVKSMFSKCRLLKEGIPSDFYTGLSANVKDFTRIFYGTQITTSQNSSGVLTNLIPSLATNVEGALAAIKCEDGNSLKSVELNLQNAINITGLFALSDVNISNIVFANNVKADYTFVNRSDSYNTNSLSTISSIGIFAQLVASESLNYNNISNPFLGVGAYYNWQNYVGQEPDENIFYFKGSAKEEKTSNYRNTDDV